MHTVMKPIVWNDAGYMHPSGGPFMAGFPAENGYGHEEWNHRPDLVFERNGKPMKIFHTEQLSRPEAVFDGASITLHLYASRGGKQAIMSTARNCEPLLRSSDLEARRAILDEVPLIRDLWEEAWALRRVQELHDDDRHQFRKQWLEMDAPWFPTWLCPVEDFFAWQTPIPVDGRAIKGARFTTRYKTSELLSAEQASRIEELLPYPATAPRSVEADVEVVNARQLDATTKKQLIDARRGQGQFREDLRKLWRGRCAVTGCEVDDVLRASHIKPWRDASDQERLDPRNGLLLSATLDALFDRYLISFEDGGKMLISPAIKAVEFEHLPLNPESQIDVPEGTKKYLTYHRQRFEDRAKNVKS
ncbi:hypothetical protein CLD20_13965 [Afifella sp. IM 167]|nr:hypothetical protein [Afifella sp. IM 167]